MTFLFALLVRGSALAGIALLVRSLPGLRRLGGHGSLLSVALAWLVGLPLLVAAGARVDIGVIPPPPVQWLAAAQREALADLAVAADPGASVSGVTQTVIPSERPGSRSVPVFLLLYLAVVALLVAARGIAAWRIGRIVRAATAPVPPALLRALAGSSRGVRPPRLAVSEHTSLPFVAGVWRPTIVFPAAVAHWEEGRIRAVLLHELAHVRRGDLVWRLVADAACALHWFNPLVWIAAARLRAESEIACDAAVLSAGVDPESYARELLQLARSLNGVPLLRSAIGVTGSSVLGERMRSILAGSRSRRGAVSTVVVTLCTSAMALGFALLSPTVAQTIRYTAGDALNISDGGPEISSNGAGLQARWKDQGHHSAIFLTGSVDLSDVAEGRLAGSGSLLLIEETGAGVRVYEWNSARPEPLPAEVRRSIQTGAQQLAALTGRRGRFPGSSQSGLPAWSDDPDAHVIQAGWLEGNLRYGLALRGAWTASGHALSSADGGAWLVLFAYDPRHESMRRLQITRERDGTLREALSVDGVTVPVDEAARQWAVAALGNLRRLSPPEYGLP